MKYTIGLLFCLVILSCDNTEKADLIIVNGEYFTATDNDSISAIAVKDGKISLTGSVDDIMAFKGDETEVIDAQGKFVMPGFIEGHGHFPNFAFGLKNLNFLSDTSWNDIVEKVRQKVAESEEGEWIYGRGWHQEKWSSVPEQNVGAYPKHNSISDISPDNPVVLVHASGHSLFANAKAMEMAGIKSETPDPKGGHIVKDLNGDPIGVFEERAMDPLRDLYAEYLDGLDEEKRQEEWMEAFELAQAECLKYGVTSFQDAGLTYDNLEEFERLAEEGLLDIRFWVMMRERAHKLSNEKIQKHRVIGAADNFYTCRAIKTEIDGALGAHGAWLLQPYSDKTDFYGQNTTEISDVEAIAKMCHDNDMQMCVHAIGDRANKETLDIIEEYNNLSEDEIRWRVEHAQHLHPDDIARFKATGAIASMQGVHCTSDAPFVEKRLGFMRAKIGAYAWQALLKNGVTIVNGTDVPVENLDPFANFYASVTRSRLDNGMRFFVEQRMSREQALRSYTIDAAYGAFEEHLKGSLEQGKLADIIILDQNLMTCSDDDIPSTKVKYTIIDGELMYKD